MPDLKIETLESPRSGKDPYQDLALAVIATVLIDRKWGWFESEIGQFWCAVARIDPAFMQRKLLQKVKDKKFIAWVKEEL